MPHRCDWCGQETEEFKFLGADGYIRTGGERRAGDRLFCADDLCWRRVAEAEEEVETSAPNRPERGKKDTMKVHAWTGAIVALVCGILLGMFAEKLFTEGFPEIALGIIFIASFSVLAAAWLQGREG